MIELCAVEGTAGQRSAGSGKGGCRETRTILVCVFPGSATIISPLTLQLLKITTSN